LTNETAKDLDMSDPERIKTGEANKRVDVTEVFPRDLVDHSSLNN